MVERNCVCEQQAARVVIIRGAFDYLVAHNRNVFAEVEGNTLRWANEPGAVELLRVFVAGVGAGGFGQVHDVRRLARREGCGEANQAFLGYRPADVHFPEVEAEGIVANVERATGKVGAGGRGIVEAVLVVPVDKSANHDLWRRGIRLRAFRRRVSPA